MGRKLCVSVCSLNQWSLDFQGNYVRILDSIRQAKLFQSQYRSGPELEICGYSCDDYFYESDTYLHSWQVLTRLLLETTTNNIICDIGMPVIHRNLAYNCRVIILNGKILFIRPKQVLCDEGNYKERRWFSPWTKDRQIEEYQLPRFVQEHIKQQTCPIGDAILQTNDTQIGFESADELLSPKSCHVNLYLDGCELISNSSSKHFRLRKTLIDDINKATEKCGGVYLLSNMRGCDGDRLYFDGITVISSNGQLIQHGSQFSLQECEVRSAIIDLEDIRSYRLSKRSYQSQGTNSDAYPRIRVEFSLSAQHDVFIPVSPPMEWKSVTKEEEIALGPACWLWDYLRRSQANGFFLALSGGVDSTSVACIVFSMCYLVFMEIERQGTNQSNDVLRDLRRIVNDINYRPRSPQELCSKLLVTCFMQHSNNNSELSKTHATNLSSEIGSGL
ncbi:unnamed protein product [Didymodactylos carnosus]|uniref:Glutamine-dependent NAD(+) synthetase n=1 Tax=Didymodactylos carnosus TaxID=1234261 RepID=A0A814ZJL4_9BILA|nr:unnamed protein product [Didymodactylos carnosus]CAF1243235.1 unnamed protein product [Didymodactylos carnosus]CAF4005777.1 unnamed protein product [Didymodactylos carnosus]CAF4007450.1 unnamed protein product [Didymodactylos carnosus]